MEFKVSANIYGPCLMVICLTVFFNTSLAALSERHIDKWIKGDSREYLQEGNRPPVSQPQHEPGGHKHAGLSVHL